MRPLNPLPTTVHPATHPTLRRRLVPPPSGRIAPQASPLAELEPIGANALPNQPDMRSDQAAEPEIPFEEPPKEKLEPLSATQLRELGASDLLIDRYMKLKIPNYLGSKGECEYYQGMYTEENSRIGKFFTTREQSSLENTELTEPIKL